MNPTSGRQRSVWLETAVAPRYSKLAEDLVCDVCVVGAGIIGLTTAYVLGHEGFSVIVLEDGEIGSGETGRTSAHLSNALDDRYTYLESKHGGEGARLAAESHSAAIDFIEQTAATERIDCHFERIDGFLFQPPDGNPSELDEEFEAARRAGLHVTWEPRAPWASFDTGRCLVFPSQAQFHPLRYLYGLAGAATA